MRAKGGIELVSLCPVGRSSSSHSRVHRRASGRLPRRTLPTTLVLAYQNNPQLNAQRAQVRVTDEAVPQALSGYRPQLSVTASAAQSFSQSTEQFRTPDAGKSHALADCVGLHKRLSGEFTP